MATEPPPEGMPLYLAPKQVAARLRISIETLRKWRKNGKGPPWIKPSRAVRYPIEAVRAWEQALRR